MEVIVRSADDASEPLGPEVEPVTLSSSSWIRTSSKNFMKEISKHFYHDHLPDDEERYVTISYKDSAGTEIHKRKIKVTNSEKHISQDDASYVVDVGPKVKDSGKFSDSSLARCKKNSIYVRYYRYV